MLRLGSMIISINGELTLEQEAKVSVLDHGFLYGMGLFETFRTYESKPFLLAEHLERLLDSCKQLRIHYNPDEERIRKQLARLIEANETQDAYFRLTVTGGVGAVGLPQDDYRKPQEIIYIKPLPPRKEGLAVQGKAVQLLRLRRNSPEGSLRLKSLHYMNNIIGKQELLQYPWASEAEGLFLNERGFVAEGIVSNIFFVKEGICYTPSLDTGILNGVTRQFVMKCCAKLGVPCQEGHYTWEELLQAEEVFLTNSIQEIVPVSSLYDPSGVKTQKSLYLRLESYTGQLMRLYQAARHETMHRKDD